MKTIALILMALSTNALASLSTSPGLSKMSCFNNNYRTARLATDKNLLQLTDTMWTYENWSLLEAKLGKDITGQIKGFRVTDPSLLQSQCRHLTAEGEIFVCHLGLTTVTLLDQKYDGSVVELATVQATVDVEQSLQGFNSRVAISTGTASRGYGVGEDVYSTFNSLHLWFAHNGVEDDNSNVGFDGCN